MDREEMTMKHRWTMTSAVLAALVAGLLSLTPLSAQEMFRAPETILAGKTLQAVLEEVSGQIAFNNEAMMAGYNRIRTPEEMTSGLMYEADYLKKVLEGYGLDTVTAESLTRPDRKTWWVGHDAEFRMVSPEAKRLARLVEQPALLIRGSDTVDCEGELVYLDRRDVPKLGEADLAGKIVLTPEHPAWLAKAFEKGALGIVSYENSIAPLRYPDQVVFDMSLQKGKPAGKVFGCRVSIRQGTQLRDMILQGQKIVVHVKTRTAEYPWKADTVFAAVRGTAPDQKGLMFTAHLFERPAKIGANDNISGSVVLAEVARTLAALVRDGKVPRPERSVYFLWSEEGSGTAAFFKSHPEMSGRILGAINMDMVGESLDANSAFFYIERPLHSKVTYLDAVARNFAEYVFRTNVEQHGVTGPRPGEPFPIPIVEKNGSRQSFRYRMQPFSGGSDHGIFIESDADIPALSFMVWPDLWYHTDQDTPDKSDPTQLKRVAFIGTSAALSVCSGSEETVMDLARTTYADRLGFVQDAFAEAVSGISSRKAADGGRAYRNGLNRITQAVRLARASLERIRELAGGKAKASRFLDGLVTEVAQLQPFYAKQLKDRYALLSEIHGLKPEEARPGADDATAAKLIPVKATPVPLGEFFPFTELFGAIGEDAELQMLAFQKIGAEGLIEMYILIDGKHSLADIRDLLSFEFDEVGSAEVLKLAKAFEKARLIKFI
jgi:aminopeptidase YwaD